MGSVPTIIRFLSQFVYCKLAFLYFATSPEPVIGRHAKGDYMTAIALNCIVAMYAMYCQNADESQQHCPENNESDFDLGETSTNAWRTGK